MFGNLFLFYFYILKINFFLIFKTCDVDDDDDSELKSVNIKQRKSNKNVKDHANNAKLYIHEEKTQTKRKIKYTPTTQKNKINQTFFSSFTFKIQN